MQTEKRWQVKPQLELNQTYTGLPSNVVDQEGIFIPL